MTQNSNAENQIDKFDFFQELFFITHSFGAFFTSILSMFLIGSLSLGSFIGVFIPVGLYGLIFLIPAVMIFLGVLHVLEKSDKSPLIKTVLTLLPMILYLLLLLVFVINYPLVFKIILFVCYTVPLILWTWKRNPWGIDYSNLNADDEEFKDILDKF